MIISDNAFNRIFIKEQQIRIRTREKKREKRATAFVKETSIVSFKVRIICHTRGIREHHFPPGFAISAFYLTFQIFHNHVIYLLPSYSITRLLPGVNQSVSKDCNRVRLNLFMQISIMILLIRNLQKL